MFIQCFYFQPNTLTLIISLSGLLFGSLFADSSVYCGYVYCSLSNLFACEVSQWVSVLIIYYITSVCRSGWVTFHVKAQSRIVSFMLWWSTSFFCMFLYMTDKKSSSWWSFSIVSNRSHLHMVRSFSNKSLNYYIVQCSYTCCWSILFSLVSSASFCFSLLITSFILSLNSYIWYS